MSTSSTLHPSTTSSVGDADRARRALPVVAVGCLLVSGTLSVTEAHDTSEWLIELGVELVATVVVFGLLVRLGLRRAAAGVRGIVLGAVGLACIVPAFWSGLPLILGAGAALLGHAGKRAGSGSGKAVVALVLGLLAVLGYAAVYVFDYLNS